MRSLLVILMLAVICLPALSADILPDDPALDKPITLAIKGEALSDVAKMILRQTGVHVRASADVADQKVTIFVDDKPLKDVMNGIATLFQFNWHVDNSKDKPVYVIYNPNRTEQADLRQKAIEKAKKELLAEIDRLAAAPIKTDAELNEPPADWKERVAKDFDMFDLPFKDNPQFLELMKNMITSEERRKYPICVPCLKVFQFMPQNAREALLQGMDVYYDSESPEPEWKISDNIVSDIESAIKKTHFGMVPTIPGPDYADVENTPDVVPQVSIDTSQSFDEQEFMDNIDYFDINDDESVVVESIPGANIKFYMETSPKFISTQADIIFRGNGNFENSDYRSILLALRSIQVEKRDEKEDYLPHDALDKLPDQKISIDRNDLMAETGQSEEFFMSLANKSDILAIFHNKLGLQIISDHYSKWPIFIDSVKDLPVNQALDVTLSRITSSNWGWDGQFLYSRIKDIYSADEAEVPNRILHPLQAAFKKQGYLDLDEFATISLLTEQQRKNIYCNEVELGLKQQESEDWMDNFLNYESDEIFFYALLSSKQRQQVFTTGIPVGALSMEQQSVLAKLISAGEMFNQVTVGIYNKSTRIDKPGLIFTSTGLIPTAIRMSCSGLVNRFKYSVKDNEYWLNATTLNEARDEMNEMKSFMTDIPQISDENFIVGHQIKYKLSIMSGDQNINESEIAIAVPSGPKNKAY